MRPEVSVRLVAVALVAVLLLSACSRLSFVRPNAERGDFRRTTEDVRIRPDTRDRAAVMGLTQMAQARLMQGDATAAKQAAERALRLDPKSVDAHSLLALALDALGDARAAGSHHRQAVTLAPARGPLLNNYGAWLCSNGQPAEAIGWLERAVAAPGYSTPHDALANAAACAYKAGQLDRAERDARHVLEVQPAHPIALLTLARRMAAAGRWLDARGFIERRLATGDADADSLQLASQIEEKLGDTAAAERYGRRLRTEFPRNSVQQGGNP